MVSMAQQYHMFPSRPNNDTDFMLYPETQMQTGYASPPTEMQYSPETFNFPHSAGFEAGAVYTEAPPFLILRQGLARWWRSKSPFLQSLYCIRALGSLIHSGLAAF
ncbi:uncharacterized protein PG986_001692 [Apiospora aurea]|uniref:Uncharacterized protein n=1 Tax=Apiospora aurea TaxID=335848 RepID=A0ABR1QXK1_9PEZI